MAELIAAARVYRRMVGARIRGDLQYRLSFAMFAAGQFMVSVIDILVVLVIFEQVPALGGWTVEEVVFLTATSAVAFGLADVFVSEVEFLPIRIREGTFDKLLLRPAGSLLQLCADEFALRRVGKLAQSLIVLAIALVWVDVDWTAGRILMMPVMLISGFVIFGGVWVTFATFTFWSTEGREVINAFTYGGNYLSQYPLGIYAAWLRRVFAIAVPLAFVNYFPALYVLDKEDALNAPDFLRFVSPLVAIASVLVARLAWRTGIRHYRSTGS